MKRKISFAARICALLLTGAFAPVAVGTSNPYCVAGADWRSDGTMARIGMPSGSLGYIWDDLYDTNVPNMVRPCRFWSRRGLPHQAHGYHEDTDSIDDPVAFGEWIDAHPGRTWIIGNEPDIVAQDDLSSSAYARMYKTCHDFILARDPTARLAVAALSASTDTWCFNTNKMWWDETLASYRAQFGADMPIDIWNCHGYARVGLLDPDRVVADFFARYRQYVDTVADGIYAGRELWCTELGVEIWCGQLHPTLIRDFMAQLCPRLEQSGVSRFFWFIGPWPGDWDESVGDLALLDVSAARTLIGQTYLDLALGYPNPIPPPSPSQSPPPPPPPRVTQDFAESADPLSVRAGEWAVMDGAYRQARTMGATGLIAQLPFLYQNVRVDVDVRIHSAASPDHWAGLAVRSGGIWSGNDYETYLVFLAADGRLGISTKKDGIVASMPRVVDDTSAFHRLRVQVVGWRIQVSVDGVPQLTWTDPQHRRTSGMVTLYAGNVDCSYDNLSVLELRPGDLDEDGDVDQDDLGLLQVCMTGPGVAQTDAGCDLARLDGDDDVDLDDLALFRACLSGPHIPSDPACMPAL